MTVPEPLRPRSDASRPRALQFLGLVLFLFIPLVLWLFVRHPAPIAASLPIALVLMVGHRFLARPYLRLAAPWKCIWCNRLLPADEESTATVELATGNRRLTARCCAAHRAPSVRFFGFLARARWPLRLGIFLPLTLLLAALLAAAAGRGQPLPVATALFQLLVGLTVSIAAWGYALSPLPPSAAGVVAEPIAVAFPIHNFFLLGLRILLWIFRLVGAWWIVRGVWFFTT